MLHVIIGPMYSGKTSLLINEFYKYKSSDKFKVICLKPSIDTRYNDDLRYNNDIESSIFSHDKKKIKAFLIEKISDKSMDLLVSKNDVFIIDEVQFVKNALSFILRLIKLEKTVIVAGLNGDFKQKSFEIMSLLIPFASKITNLSARCSSCGKEAIYTIRKDSKTDGKRIIIGGKDIYSVSCGKCLFNSSKDKEKNKK